MRHLRSRISTEVANTEGERVSQRSQIFRRNAPFFYRRHIPEVPVLTEKAIVSAASVKNCQIVVTIFSMPRANPIGYAVGGEGIAIPVKHAL